MKKIINKFLLAVEKFMHEMHSKHPGFTYNACGHLLKIKKDFRNLKKEKIQNISTKMSYIKLAFNMIWFMEILKILQEEQLQMKYYVIRHLILRKTYIIWVDKGSEF